MQNGKRTRIIIDVNVWINYLITGDDDLLTLKNFGKTKIVKITEFEQTV